jgi:hypothetical protein
MNRLQEFALSMLLCRHCRRHHREHVNRGGHLRCHDGGWFESASDETHKAAVVPYPASLFFKEAKRPPPAKPELPKSVVKRRRRARSVRALLEEVRGANRARLETRVSNPGLAEDEGSA